MSRNDSSERFMLRVLKETFPEELGGLSEENSQQKPDFQDLRASIGVEATIAQHGNNRLMQAYSLFKELQGKTLKTKDKEKLRNLGVVPVCENGILRGISDSFWEGDSYPAIEEAVVNKLEKLNNGNYDAVSDIRLVIKDCFDVQRAELLASAIRCAYARFVNQGRGARHFTHIYVIPDTQKYVYDYVTAIDKVETYTLLCSDS